MQYHRSQRQPLDGVSHLARPVSRARQMIEGLKAGQHVNDLQRLRELAEAGVSILSAHAFENRLQFLPPACIAVLHALCERGIQRRQRVHSPDHETIRIPHANKYSDEFQKGRQRIRIAQRIEELCAVTRASRCS